MPADAPAVNTPAEVAAVRPAPAVDASPRTLERWRVASGAGPPHAAGRRGGGPVNVLAALVSARSGTKKHLLWREIARPAEMCSRTNCAIICELSYLGFGTPKSRQRRAPWLIHTKSLG